MTGRVQPTPIHQAMRVVDRARWAGSEYSNFGRDSVLKIAKAAADLGIKTARQYADWALKKLDSATQIIRKSKIKCAVKASLIITRTMTLSATAWTKKKS